MQHSKKRCARAHKQEDNAQKEYTRIQQEDGKKEAQKYYTYWESDYTMVEYRRERKVELAELRGARAGKHQWRTHHNAARQSSSRPAPQESHLRGSEQVIGMLQPLMLGEEEQEKPCVLCWSLSLSIAHLWFSGNTHQNNSEKWIKSSLELVWKPTYI